MENTWIEVKMIEPTEANKYSLFDADLENDPHVFFHLTPHKNLDSIRKNGFRSAADLGVTGGLPSVSYARNSSRCLSHVSCEVAEDTIVFAVKFDNAALLQVKDCGQDIYVYLDVQPRILGYCVLKAGFRVQ